MTPAERERFLAGYAAGLPPERHRVEDMARRLRGEIGKMREGEDRQLALDRLAVLEARLEEGAAHADDHS